MDRGRKPTRIAVEDIVSVSASADLTLPPGAGLCVDTVHGPRFLVCICQLLLFVCSIEVQIILYVLKHLQMESVTGC